MIVAMQERATEEDIQGVIERLVQVGFNVNNTGAVQTVLAGVGTPSHFDHKDFELLPGVAEVVRISSPYKLAGRGFRPEGTIVRFSNGVAGVSGDEIVVMAGPCSVESREQIFTIADQVKSAGASFLRGGAFKPRSSPYSFQGLGLEGLKLLREVGDRTGLLIISEVMEISQIDLMFPYVDVFQGRRSQHTGISISCVRLVWCVSQCC